MLVQKLNCEHGFIEYYIKSPNIYLMTVYIEPNKRRCGYGTELIKDFISQYSRDYNIYTFASNELGTDIKVLFKWYLSLGFQKCNQKIKGLENINLCFRRVANEQVVNR